MAVNSEIMFALSEVLSAGAQKSRQWVTNIQRQQEADVYEAMAEKAREQAMILQSREL